MSTIRMVARAQGNMDFGPRDLSRHKNVERRGVVREWQQFLKVLHDDPGWSDDPDWNIDAFAPQKGSQSVLEIAEIALKSCVAWLPATLSARNCCSKAANAERRWPRSRGN